ncbi:MULTISPECIES: hypothetical protein [unclassified Sulfitobacter]|uniref:hypothetical protein n=1 Tax=unclassified Sulfitobacter TaxID=196795 RepID=UPI0023E33780|nr:MULTISPECIES: hypothetical protein [unclassified Sulfitobacter]
MRAAIKYALTYKSAEVINVFSLPIKLGLAAARVKSMAAAYPTGASDIGSMF